MTASPGVRLRRRRDLEPLQEAVGSPPRTRVEATVIDLAATSTTAREIVGVVTTACQLRRTTPARLNRELARRAQHPRRKLLLALLTDVADGAESPLELGFLRRVERAHGLPRGVRQHRIPFGGGAMVVDVYYERYATYAELDGRVGHLGDGAFRDHQRDNLLAVRGGTTLRYGWVAVTDQPCDVATQLAGVLHDRGWRGSIRRCGPACTALGVARTSRSAGDARGREAKRG